MCRVEGDRVYYCDNARSGRTCRDVRRVPTSYGHQRGSASRDDTPSPVNPPTPTSSGTYLTQRRRPSNSGSRPSTRDGQRINPEIIIEIGSKKGKSGKYPSLSISTKNHKRHSFGSLGSNDAAVDSGESEASYTVRTGFPEAPLPPTAAYDQPNAFLPTPLPTHGYYHRHTPSASSSQTPSLTVPSEPDFDLSATRRSTRPSAPIIHHSATDPASPTWAQRGPPSGSYKTKRIVPRDLPQATQTPTSTHPLDYDQYADHSGSSRASSGIVDPPRPAKNSSQRRKKSSEDHILQGDVNRRITEDFEKSENDKHVRFELGRYEAREKERAEKALAEKEKERAAFREAERDRKRSERLEQEKERLEREKKERLEREKKDRLEREKRERLEREKREREDQQAKDRKKERSKPPTTDSTKRPTSSRRMSSLMTPQEQAEQQRLLQAESLVMQREKEAAEAREREERRAAVRQQQESSYYDPRGGDRSLSNANNASKTRRDSVASTTRPSGLSNTPSRRHPSISQPNPPPVISQLPTDYPTRPQMSRAHAPPPLSFPKNFNQDYARPPSARRASLTQDNPFLSAAVTSPVADPWDVRNMDQALPSARTSDGRKHNSTQPWGEPIVHGPTHSVRRTTQYVSTFDDDDDDLDSYQPTFASRTGLSRSGSLRRKN